MLHIRVAVREDAQLILDQIKHLAEYEKEPHSVHCTEEDILRDGFGEKPLFECLIAEWDGETVGFAVYYFKWSTWTGSACLHLEDLFVDPDHRGRKIGFTLLKRLAAIAVERKCHRFEWDVLDWNKLAIDFYESLGAGPKDSWLTYRLDGEALEKLAAHDQ